MERAGDIGYAKVISESGISQGVRRIEMLAGRAAVLLSESEAEILKNTAAMLNCARDELTPRVRDLLDKNKAFERELGLLKQQQGQSKGSELVEAARTTANGVKFITSVVNDATPAELRAMADDLKLKLKKRLYSIGQ